MSVGDGQHLCALLDQIADLAFIKDADGRCVACNAAFAARVGADAGDLSGRLLAQILPEPIARGLALHDDEVLASGRPRAFEHTLSWDGDPRTYAARKAVWPDPAADRTAILYLGWDVTERRRADRDVAEREARCRRIADAATEGVCELDAEDRIAYVNARMAQMLGRTAQEMVGRPFLDFLDDPARPLARERLRERRQGGRDQFEMRLSGRDGTELTALFEVSALRDASGRYGGTRCVVLDVTETKKAEQDLIQVERQAAVGTLVAGIVHQFNNLNAPILGYSDFLLNLPDLDPRARRYVEQIHAAALRGREVTRSLATFARLRSAGARRPADLNRVVRETVDVLKDSLRADGVDLELRLGDVPQAPMHQGEISQVVLALVQNAQHAVLERPERRIAVETGVADQGAFVRVSDTGCGIAEADLPKIFTPFFTTKGEFAPPGSSQHQVRGAGLGLSVAQTIAAHHEGELTVQSRPGRGSTFLLRLPLSGAQRQAAPAGHAPAEARAEGRRVLVLDDEPSSRELFSEVLDAYGYLVEATDDGGAALGLLRGRRFDAILVDLAMPKMSGAAFLRGLAELPEPQRPVVLVVTGRTEAPEPPQGVEVAEVLYKPFEPTVLLAGLHKALAARREGS